MKYGEENILRAETYKESRISVTLDSDWQRGWLWKATVKYPQSFEREITLNLVSHEQSKKLLGTEGGRQCQLKCKATWKEEWHAKNAEEGRILLRLDPKPELPLNLEYTTYNVPAAKPPFCTRPSEWNATVLYSESTSHGFQPGKSQARQPGTSGMQQVSVSKEIRKPYS